MNHEEMMRIEVYRNMTPLQKYEEMLKLRRFAISLKRAAVREKHPDWSDEQINSQVREIFLYARS